MRSEHAASIDDAMREAMGLRLTEEYGGTQGAADAVWALARQNRWYREGERADRYLLRPVAAPVRNAATLDLIVAWHGDPIGHLLHDGFEWHWRPTAAHHPPLIRQTTPGRLPPFVRSRLPEGWLEAVLSARDERSMLRSGRRYMSNITVVGNRQELRALPADLLMARLADFSHAGVFTGRYRGPGRSSMEQAFEQNLARLFERTDRPCSAAPLDRTGRGHRAPPQTGALRVADRRR